ncbi:SRPBCC family protein [Mobilicoccus caccae]|uniref:Polyketide cyclase / dehydrase and lipid transport n=1 Tax=Mobilicoccus caccae TaxID=1859295 RepID=A0ABQ6ITB0_9MICO|nr:SRPBCC family protein [Mobilicoccus caccae]GMA40901.1 hypothetical protein GCM10025883_29460 [Mobilicoccus caccae]
MEYRTTVEIASDIGTVWAALADPEAWPIWQKDVKSVEAARPGTPMRYGSEYTVKQVWWKFDTQKIQIREVEDRRRLAFGATTTAGEFVFEYLLSERPDRRVVVESVLRAADMTAQASGFMGGAEIEKQLVAESTMLRDHCESASPQDVIRG